MSRFSRQIIPPLAMILFGAGAALILFGLVNLIWQLPDGLSYWRYVAWGAAALLCAGTLRERYFEGMGL